MKWLRPLYLGEEIAHKSDKVIRVVEKRKLSFYSFCYLLVLSPFGRIELVPAGLLDQVYTDPEALTVLGLAASSSEGKKLLERLVNDCLGAGFGTDPAAYIRSLPEDRFSDRGEVGV